MSRHEPERPDLIVSLNQEEGTLTIVLPLNNPPRLSVSEKTLVIASTYGNAKTNIQLQGRPLILGVNAYIRR